MRKFLLVALIAGLAFGAAALAQTPPTPTQSVSCVSDVLTPNLACTWTTPVTTFATLKVTGGAFAELDPNVQGVLELAPYVEIASAPGQISWYVKVTMPKIQGVPVFGVSDPLVAGFSFSW